MTLKEKFKPFVMDNHIEKYAEHNANECVKIADEFAIGFAEFLEGRDLYLERKTILEVFTEFKELEKL